MECKISFATITTSKRLREFFNKQDSKYTQSEQIQRSHKHRMGRVTTKYRRLLHLRRVETAYYKQFRRTTLSLLLNDGFSNQMRHS